VIRTAADLMTRDVLTVHEDLGVRELADFLTENGISGVPVLDSEGRPVGVVTVTDITEMGRREPDVRVDRSDPRFFVRSFDEQLDFEELRTFHLENEESVVRDIMTPKVLSVPSDMPVPEIAKEMISARIHRLFVTDLGGQLVGVVSALDLLKLLAEAP
jgi:CBS domain-containing protein